MTPDQAAKLIDTFRGLRVEVPTETSDKVEVRRGILKALRESRKGKADYVSTSFAGLVSQSGILAQELHLAFLNDELIPEGLEVLKQKQMPLSETALIVADALPGSGRHGNQVLGLLNPYMDSMERLQALTNLQKRVELLINLGPFSDGANYATRQIAALGAMGDMAIELDDSVTASRISPQINSKTNSGFFIRHREESLSVESQRFLMQGWISAGFLGARFDQLHEENYSPKHIFQQATQGGGVRAVGCFGTVEDGLLEERVLVGALMLWNRTSKDLGEHGEFGLRRNYESTAQILFGDLLKEGVSFSTKVFGLLAMTQHGGADFSTAAQEEMGKTLPALDSKDFTIVAGYLKKMEVPQEEAARSFGKPTFQRERFPISIQQALVR